MCQHKVFEEALNAVKFLCWFKKFGPARNILGPVKGQGINVLNRLVDSNLIFFQEGEKKTNVFIHLMTLGFTWTLNLRTRVSKDDTPKMVLRASQRYKNPQGDRNQKQN